MSQFPATVAVSMKLDTLWKQCLNAGVQFCARTVQMAVVAENGVIPCAAVQIILGTRAGSRIVSAEDDVVALVAMDCIGPANVIERRPYAIQGGRDKVALGRAVLAAHGLVRRIIDPPVVAEENVVTGVAVNVVVSQTAHNRIVAGTADNRVVAADRFVDGDEETRISYHGVRLILGDVRDPVLAGIEVGVGRIEDAGGIRI